MAPTRPFSVETITSIEAIRKRIQNQADPKSKKLIIQSRVGKMPLIKDVVLVKNTNFNFSRGSFYFLDLVSFFDSPIFVEVNCIDLFN